MKLELKSCPFCGGKANVINTYSECYVECSFCHARSESVKYDSHYLGSRSIISNEVGEKLIGLWDNKVI